jgi:hypothetical protein
MAVLRAGIATDATTTDAAAHVGAVVLSAFRRCEGLVCAMVISAKRAPGSRRHRLTGPTMGRFLPDGKLKRKSPRRQEALRPAVQIGPRR